MRTRLGLLRWFFSPPLMMGQAACMLIAWGYVLLRREPLGVSGEGWFVFFILLHSIVLVRNIRGSAYVNPHGFLYSRGFTRDALWTHSMLAHAVAVLMVWAPAAVFVWTPIRSVVQDTFFQNPYFPIFAPTEQSRPWFWLLCYALFAPPLHYAWIRRTQPTRGRNSGDLLVLALIAAWSVACGGPPLMKHIAVGLGAAMFAILLVASHRLHRTMEAPQ